MRDDIKVLNRIYQGTMLGRTAIDELRCHTGDKGFAAEIRRQESRYRELGTAAAQQLCDLGRAPKDISGGRRAAMRMGVNSLGNGFFKFIIALDNR